ncbi:unnamed protein product, partial [Phaeothamnion confervicola]
QPSVVVTRAINPAAAAAGVGLTAAGGGIGAGAAGGKGAPIWRGPAVDIAALAAATPGSKHASRDAAGGTVGDPAAAGAVAAVDRPDAESGAAGAEAEAAAAAAAAAAMAAAVAEAAGEKEVCHLHVGQYFGEMALVYSDQGRRSATVRAASAVVDTVSVGKEDFDKWTEFKIYLLMKEVPLLANMPPATLVAIQRMLHYADFAPRQYIVRQGEQGDAFYMITKGVVEVLEADPHSHTGAEKCVVQMYEGHYFGELALIYDEPRNASVRAVGRVSCMYIKAEDFRSCLNEKRFQEVLEEVAIQRAIYREQREDQRAMLKAKLRVRNAANANGGGVGGGNRPFGLNKSLSGGTLNAIAAGNGGSGFGGGFGGDSSGGPSPGSAADSTDLPSIGSATGTLYGPSTASPTPSSLAVRRNSFRETAKVVKRRLENGMRIINKYRVVEELGRGAYGTVHLCQHEETGQFFAMKVLDKKKRGHRREQLAKSLRREVAAMKKLRHPNIVTLWEVIDDPRAQQLYMIQDYVERGPLLREGNVVPPMTMAEARRKFMDCVRGLHYLHKHQIIHGDVKPANLLVSKDGGVKIADFGAAVVSQNDVDDPQDIKNQKLISTPAFMAPELFGEHAITRVSPASDVWALGVTLYQMVYGRLPFWSPNGSHFELEYLIGRRELAFPSPAEMEGIAAAAAAGVAAAAAAGGGAGATTPVGRAAVAAAAAA